MKSTHRNFRKENKLKFIVSAILTIMMLFSLSTAVFASNTKTDNTSRGKLNQTVSNAVSNKEYQTTNGATLRGDQIVSDKTNGVVNENFESLTTKGKKALLQDMMDAVDDKVSEDSANLSNGKVSGNGGKLVTEDTKSDWLADLQSCEGIGSQLMTTLVQVKPDYVKALTILKPFNGLLGTILGVLAMGLVGVLGIVIILDLAYMCLPVIRNMGAENNSGTGGRPSWVSFEAYSAVQEAEREGEGGKVWKAAIFIYIKRRTLMLIAFGIALGYLVSGQIYVLVGWILDLMRGVLKF